jgi:hypothetical protein
LVLCVYPQYLPHPYARLSFAKPDLFFPAI